MPAELPTLEEVEDDTGGLDVVPAGASVELGVDEADEGCEASTGQTSASTPPIVKAVQLLKGARGKPANA